MALSLNRRQFNRLASGCAAAAVVPYSAAAAPSSQIKPISGSWFEFQHHATIEGIDWNPALAQFTAEQWTVKIKEIADAGLKYLVLMATAVYYRAFFQTDIYPQWKLACSDPLEAVLSAADRYGVQFFIGGGFYGAWESDRIITDPRSERDRLRAIEQVATRYAHHPSFYGWYWPDEACLNPRFSPEFLRYVNVNSALARQLTPGKKTLIAPYGTRMVIPDDDFVRQLDRLDIDIVAYQDEVGVGKSKVDETSKFYQGLRLAHHRAQRARLWADVEIFEFESENYRSALIPAPFSRVQKQLEAVAPWVDEILVYQYLGMMNQPGTAALAGGDRSLRLYQDYRHWRDQVRV